MHTKFWSLSFQRPRGKVHFNNILPATLRDGQPGFNSRQEIWWDLPLHNRVQAGSGAPPASYLMHTVGSNHGDKATGAWSCTSTPPVHVHGVVINYARDVL